MANQILRESAQFKTSHTPIALSQLSSQTYVLSIASLPTHYAASASAPSNTIDIFDKITLQGVETLAGHEISTTSLHSVDNLAGNPGRTLVSSGKDGSVKVWDPRSTAHGIKMTNVTASRALLCCDVSPDGLTIAAGTDLQGDDALIVYWDPRRPDAPLRTHGSTHSDDITTVSFSKTGLGMLHNVLLSASSDGLISTSNADEDDEDESVLHVGNWGCSISQAGWNDSLSGPKIWAASDMETFSTWTEELDQCQSQDIRNPALHGRRTWVTDYTITCGTTTNTRPALGVFVGSNEGDIALLSNADLSTPGAPWSLHNIWSNGHVGIVRSVLWDEENNVLITGGEDAKIRAWPTLSLGGQGDDDSMDVE